MGAVTNGQPSRAAINRGGVRPDIRVMIDTDLVLRFGYFDTRTFL